MWIPTFAAVAFALIARVSGSERRTKYGCEGSTLNIECEEGTVIHLVRANYGRFSISICNKKGNTNWSVNCMEPRTLRVINSRCGDRTRCSVPVDSEIFGDPCPGTHKYVEVHYTCEPQVKSTTTAKPQPPWLLDLAATPSPVWKIKKTTTTETTTTTTTTASTTTTTPPATTTTTSGRPSASSTKRVVPTQPAYVHVTDQDANVVRSDDGISRSDRPNLDADMAVLEAVVDHCPPVTERSMFWNWTRAGQKAIQPCPGGSSGFAKWSCDSEARWAEGSPDLSECQSHWLNRLGQRLQEGESVVSVSSDLAAVTGTRALYGGDLVVAAQLMQSLAHRLRQDLFSMSNQEQKETLSAELMQNIMKTASNLLEDMQGLAWNDLRPIERASAGTSLLLGIEENALLLAETINSEKNMVDVTNNILSSVRIMRSRDVPSQVFPSFDSLHMAGEASITIPPQALVETSVNGAVRIIFFLYNKMDQILPSSTNGIKFLNSKVVSAAVSKGRHLHLSEPVSVTLRHLQSQSVQNPSCMWWDYVSRTWNEDGCYVTMTNMTHTTCRCSQLGNIAVLMEEGVNAALKSGPGLPPHLAPVVAGIVTLVACVCLTLVGLLVVRRLDLKPNLQRLFSSGRLPCFHCRDKDKSTGLFPGINTSPTSTTISSGTPTTHTTMSSNYYLSSDCQVPQSVLMGPNGGASTVYRAKLANGQEAHVIPISHVHIQDPNNHYFRPVSPFGHIYMEIDPVYSHLEQSETQSDIQLSDLSDDDLKRCSDVSRQSSNRYAEERPLIRTQLRKSAPSQRHCQTTARQLPLKTVSGACSGSLRYADRQRQLLLGKQVAGPNHMQMDTPINIALTPGGDQFVSMQLDRSAYKSGQMFSDI